MCAGALSRWAAEPLSLMDMDMQLAMQMQFRYGKLTVGTFH